MRENGGETSSGRHIGHEASGGSLGSSVTPKRMPSNSLARRSLTVISVLVTFAVLTALSPVLVPVAAILDLVRRLVTDRPAMALRSLAFLWVYLLGEIWAVVALALTAPLPNRTRMEATFRLQERWAGWNMMALRRLFSVEFKVTGRESLLPGPIIVLSRHASIVDTLLPASFVARPTGLRIRYVLKKELLVDPALDIAGNRLPNVFVDRASRDLTEREALEAVAGSMGPGDGILIYPEGTRFSTEKLARAQRRASEETGSSRMVAGLRRVLPPRPGGTLTILDATDADVVVLAHRGLEGLATLEDIWHGDLVGSRVDVALWRIRREEIPTSRADRAEWLYRLWTEVDEWVVAASSASETSR
jgi:1-acyl-sn-glycerol-3-phosphate acyltransferase